MPEREFVVIDAEDLDEARRIAADNGVETEQAEARFIDPGTVTLVLLGSSLAVATVVHLLEQHKGGQVIDQRPGAPNAMYRSKNVVYGLVVLVATDGTVTIEVKEPKGMFGQVIDAITGILTEISKDGAEQIAKTVKNTIGNAGTVTVGPTTD